MVNQRISLISKLVLSIGLFYGASGAIAAPGEDSIARGKQVYNQQCAACHQAGGQGSERSHCKRLQCQWRYGRARLSGPCAAIWPDWLD